MERFGTNGSSAIENSISFNSFTVGAFYKMLHFGIDILLVKDTVIIEVTDTANKLGIFTNELIDRRFVVDGIRDRGNSRGDIDDADGTILESTVVISVARICSAVMVEITSGRVMVVSFGQFMKALCPRDFVDLPKWTSARRLHS